MQTMSRTDIQTKVEYLDISIKAVDDAQGEIRGFLSACGNVDLGSDKVVKGAFRESIKEASQRRAASGSPFLWPLLWQHNGENNLPIGGITSAVESSKGLEIIARLQLDYQLARDCYNAVKFGSIGAMSIGYKTIDSSFEYDRDTQTNVRLLKQIDLKEGSLVLWPMNPQATISGIKNFDTKGQASGNTNLPLLDIGTTWTGSKAEQQIFAWSKDAGGNIQASKARQCFLWVDPDNSDVQSGYKMPFCYIVDGSPKIVPLGVRACAGVLAGGMGGGNFGGAVPAMKTRVATLYARINDKFAPTPEWSVSWGKGNDMDYDTKEGRVLSAQTLNVLSKAVKGITAHVNDVEQHMRAMRANSLAGFPMYPMMSSSEDYDISSALAALTDALEGKEGRVISAENAVKIGQATTNIKKHVAILKGMVDEHQRLRDLTGYPRIASDESGFDTKAEDPILDELRELRASLDGAPARSLESRMDELSAKIGVYMAMAALLSSAGE